MRRLAVLAAAVVAASTAVSAHEGHDHGAPPPPVTSTIAPRGEASSNDLEIVVIARGEQLVVHVDSFRTNAPIATAAIEIDSPAGLLKPEPTGDGVHTVAAPFLAVPGSYQLAVTVQADDLIDVLPVTLVIPPQTVTSVPATGGTWLSTPAIADGLTRHFSGADASSWLLVLLGFMSGLGAAGLLRGRGDRARAAVLVVTVGLLGVAATPAHAESRAPPVAVRDIAQRLPDGALFVPKPTQHILGVRTIFTQTRSHPRSVELPGRVVPDPNASGLVQASIGGRLYPPQGGFKPIGSPVKADDILAYVRPPLPLADLTQQQQQARELDQQIAIVARKVERLRSIERVIAKSQLEDAELELKGLSTRRANLDRAERASEALVAPVAGVIASANAVAGQMADPNAVIFHIVDPFVLWIEALSYEAIEIAGPARAVRSDGQVLELVHVGTGLGDRNQAVPIHFAIRSEAPKARVGQFVTVLATTTQERTGIAVPREAVLRGSNGQSLVYEHTNAERFLAREVRIEPLDGANVLVVAGLTPGRRIVTQGAELLNQIR
jgi:hypothetical protein